MKKDTRIFSRPGQTYVGELAESLVPSLGSSLILFLFTPFFFAVKASSCSSCFTDSLNDKMNSFSYKCIHSVASELHISADILA